MTFPIGAYVSCQGGGPEGDRIAGAVAAVRERVLVLGYSGASVGAIVATLFAFGLPAGAVLGLLEKMLQHYRMIDPSPGMLLGSHWLKWEVIAETCDHVLGSDARMSDAVSPLVIVVCDLDRGAPMYLSKKHTPGVLVKEALAASCAVHPRITGAPHIRSLGTEINPDVRHFADGGWTDNTCDGVWDEHPAPRIAIRLAGEPLKRVRDAGEGGPPLDLDLDLAAAKAALWAASQPKTKRTDGLDIILPRSGDGWDFSKSADKVRSNWHAGFDAALAALAAREATT